MLFANNCVLCFHSQENWNKWLMTRECGITIRAKLQHKWDISFFLTFSLQRYYSRTTDLHRRKLHEMLHWYSLFRYQFVEGYIGRLKSAFSCTQGYFSNSNNTFRINTTWIWKQTFWFIGQWWFSHIYTNVCSELGTTIMS